MANDTFFFRQIRCNRITLTTKLLRHYKNQTRIIISLFETRELSHANRHRCWESRCFPPLSRPSRRRTFGAPSPPSFASINYLALPLLSVTRDKYSVYMCVIRNYSNNDRGLTRQCSHRLRVRVTTVSSPDQSRANGASLD